MNDNFYSLVNDLLSREMPFATATVVRAEKPTSSKPGDKAAITADGVMHGWIGGSCAQPTVIRESLKAMSDGESRLVRLSPDPQDKGNREGLLDLPMTCFSGGTLEIFIEPQLPTPRLMVIGNLPIAQNLTRLAKFMKYHVVAVDPDGGGVALPEADTLVTSLDHLLDQITPLTYVVVASHGQYDEIALQQVLRSKASYVALVTSKNRAEAVVDYLAVQGVTPVEIARLKYPAGLDIKAARAEEIALSIMAEIVQHRRRGLKLDPQALLVPVVSGPAALTALDPVCGTEVEKVEIEGAGHTYQYNNQTYYFCCPGCKGRFAKNPLKFLTQPAPAGEALDPICGMTVEIANARYMSDYQGQFYYFCAASCKLAFDKMPVSYIK